MLALQLGHPKVNRSAIPVIRRLKDAFFHLFRAEEESVYLYWHQIPLRFRYREDLYHNFDEILAMAWLIQQDDRGATTVDFTTQLLAIHWELRWEGEHLFIRSTFSGLDDLYAPYAQALNRRPEMQVSRSAFLSEWKTLLHQVITAFESGRVKIQDGTERRKWEMLKQVEQQIPRYGRLYIQPQ